MLDATTRYTVRKPYYTLQNLTIHIDSTTKYGFFKIQHTVIELFKYDICCCRLQFHFMYTKRFYFYFIFLSRKCPHFCYVVGDGFIDVYCHYLDLISYRQPYTYDGHLQVQAQVGLLPWMNLILRQHSEKLAENVLTIS